ncbi:MAG: DUF3418 domain-containing protein, partial [Actinobacteria bacterium]|nr:DUF3418 domain-containing protein [Actinomycetota bacterium]
AGRLPDVLRYLRAAERRLDRLARDPDRDAERMLRVQRLEDELDRLFDLLPSTPALHDVAWMLQ